MTFFRIIKRNALSYYQFLFPPKKKLSTKELNTLKYTFPNLDFSKINFYKRLPWFTALFSPFTRGITTTGFFTNEINIYLKKGFHRPSLLVHECVHAQQFLQKGNRGIGILKFNICLYILEWLVKGYEKSAFEIEAYTFENAFKQNESSRFLSSKIQINKRYLMPFVVLIVMGLMLIQMTLFVLLLICFPVLMLMYWKIS